jgi:hypothetical protein
MMVLILLVSNFIFSSKTMVFFLLDVFVFGFEAWKHILQDGTKCVTFKTQITGGRIKIPEEDFEIELKADNFEQ